MKTSSAIGLVSAGLVAGLVVAGLNVASAQTSPTPSPSSPTAPKAEGKHRPGGPGGPGGLGRGLMGALHGEVTTKAPGGGYQVLAMQRGQATAVSATSITVKSEDGYSRTYAVNGDTVVKSADNGIADVANGDQVNVIAVVTGDNARAVSVVDVTKVGELGGKWRPRRGPRPAPSASAAV